MHKKYIEGVHPLGLRAIALALRGAPLQCESQAVGAVYDRPGFLTRGATMNIISPVWTCRLIFSVPSGMTGFERWPGPCTQARA